MFKCSKNIDDSNKNTFKYSIEQSEKINKIVITNSKKSKDIYIVNDIIIKSDKILPNMSLFSKELSSESITHDDLLQIINEDNNIYIEDLSKDILELDNIKPENVEFNLIHKYSLIMLPGSQIIISLDDKIDKLNIQLNIEKKQIYS